MMLSTILRRLASALPVLFVVAVLVFSLIRVIPGDPAALVAGDEATVQQIAAIREQMGLNEPILQQFYEWVNQVAHGDLGISLISGLPVSQIIESRMWPTIVTMFYCIIYILIFSIPAGIAAAYHRGKAIDKAVSLASVIGFSVPVFIIAYLLILIFSVWLRWIPVQGYAPLSAGLWPHLQHLILPVASLATIYISLISRFTRTSILDTLNEDYIRTARAKGLSESKVMLRHALPNAAIPIITITGIVITIMIGGVVVTENVFNVPGLGRLVVEAIQARDFTVIQALIVIFSFFNILVNLIVDIAYCLLDPKIRI